jgi:Family of unknown function (DUF6444)
MTISQIVARSFRDDRIDELERENTELSAKIREQQAIIQTQQKTIAALEWRNKQLEARLHGLEAMLARNSGNSSYPPSSDPPFAPPPAPPKRTGRKRGGQSGHEKHSRQLVPPERVNRTLVVKPEVCRRCGDALQGDDPAPHRHQVIEVPKVMATVDEYRLHALDCPKCGIYHPRGAGGTRRRDGLVRAQQARLAVGRCYILRGDDGAAGSGHDARVR